MLFFTFNNEDILFAEKELTWRSYTAAKALQTIKQVELIGKKEFAKAALDEESKTSVRHIITLGVSPGSPKITMHPSQAVQITALKQDEAPTKVSLEYKDYAYILSFDLAIKSPKNSGININAIELENGKQTPYRLIYSVGLVELDTLKTYIKTHLKIGFIWFFKSLASTPILFNKKPDNSFWLYVNYQGFNNLTIKNWYLLPPIRKVLDWLSSVKQFTQLDLTSTYHQMKIREGDEGKTAFRTQYSHFKWQIIPFGLSDTLASFRGYINKILGKKLDVFVNV